VQKLWPYLQTTKIRKNFTMQARGICSCEKGGKEKEKHTDSNTGKNKLTVETIMFVLF
jgi:hypothetical protein